MTAFRRYAPFYTALACGLVTLAFALWFWPALAVQGSANVFFVVYLFLEFLKFRTLTAAFLKKHAASADEPAWVIVLVTFGAVLVAVGSLFALINKGGQPNVLELVLSLTSVALGWFSIHTMTAIHYAHLYWRPEKQPADRSAKKPSESARHGGLGFPGDEDPGGYDFLYYSLVIGMTAQTSDVNVTRTAMRKLTLAHAVVSFFFNTVLVAAAVNVAVSLAAN
jgi:uncharacterized membrane protein